MKIKIYWLRKALEGKTPEESISHICEVMSLPKGMNVNRVTEADVSESILPRLKEAEKQGFLIIRTKL